MPAKPQIFTIPIGTPFADALADTLIAETHGDKLALARGLILLPTNRAIQAIRDAFVRRAEPGLLLPRLVAIGDPEIDEAIGAALDPIAGDPPPPAIDSLQRQIALARLVQDRTGAGAAEAMRLARALGRTRDQLLIEDKTAADLRGAVKDSVLAGHWEVALKQLEALLTDWPRWLKAQGRIDLAERRTLLLDRLSARWRVEPPPGFVVAAGIDSAAPAIARLLKTVARMPNGRVVFAGLDLAMPQAEWDEIGGGEEARSLESHPQFHLRKLLDGIGAGRGEVRLWPGETGAAKRAAFVSRVFAPPAATAGWANLSKPQKSAPGLAALALETAAHEAQTIALALRHAIETPGRTAALITPDRDLATRVSAHLARWGVEADDSAGKPLSATPPGALLLAIAQAWAEGLAPAALMAMLKHPLVKSEDAAGRLDWLEGVRLLDRALRGPRPAPGTAGIAAHLRQGDDRTLGLREAAAVWWAETAPLLAPLEARATGLAATLDRLTETATALAGDRIWAGQEGRALGEQVAALRQGFAEHRLTADPASIPQLLRDSLAAVSIRPQPGGHPRIHIWGLIEARLQRADLLILGGLNEGVWPAIPAPDPWLAPQIRRSLELPGLERGIGLSAHDLATALGASEVLLTRSKREGRAPSVASRFWLRLETLMGTLPPPETPYGALALALDRHEGEPQRAKRPRPKPKAEHRPKTISVTAADRMVADPYAFYASAILGLNPLDPLNAEAGPGWRGSVIHNILDLWGGEDDFAAGALAARIETALDGPAIHPLVRALALPKLREAAGWIEAQVAEGRAEGREPLLSEEGGKAEIAGVTVTARADRIDRLPDGMLAIVDYKTGTVPSGKQLKAGMALQLGLTGAIADRGGFANAKGTSAAFEYWSWARDPKTRAFGKIVSASSDKTFPAESFAAEIAAIFRAASERWLTGDEAFTAKRSPEYARADYDQLMRLEEWEGRDG